MTLVNLSVNSVLILEIHEISSEILVSVKPEPLDKNGNNRNPTAQKLLNSGDAVRIHHERGLKNTDIFMGYRLGRAINNKENITILVEFYFAHSGGKIHKEEYVWKPESLFEVLTTEAKINE